jgi:hypothetical protein
VALLIVRFAPHASSCMPLDRWRERATSAEGLASVWFAFTIAIGPNGPTAMVIPARGRRTMAPGWPRRQSRDRHDVAHHLAQGLVTQQAPWCHIHEPGSSSSYSGDEIWAIQVSRSDVVLLHTVARRFILARSLNATKPEIRAWHAQRNP